MLIDLHVNKHAGEYSAQFRKNTDYYVTALMGLKILSKSLRCRITFIAK